MIDVSHEVGSGDVFADLGFGTETAAELNVKSSLISAIQETIRERGLTQIEAARLCSTDQPTLSKVLRGRMESVTIDRLTAWLIALGRTLEIHIMPFDRNVQSGKLIVA